MKTLSWEQWRHSLVEKLEALHMLTVEAEAFHSAFNAIYSTTTWPTEGDPERRRALNRMGCFLDELNSKLDALIRDSQEVVKLAMRPAS
jgi:hypothetical protein